MSTQDRAIRGGETVEHEAGDAEGAVATGGLDPARMRAMQRRWIQRKAGGASSGGGQVGIPEGGGAPLGGSVQARMERTLGADLSGVRVHTGGESAQAAESLGARAFTVGSDVHFGRGEFAPGSKEGDRLLAHELAHVVQGAKSGVQRKPAAHDSDAGDGDHEAGGHEVSEPGDASEHEADAAGDHAAETLHGGGAAHGDSDAGGKEHGDTAGGDKAGGDKAGGDAGGKKISAAAARPKLSAAAPELGRKIFRAKSGAKPPPLPADAKKGKAPAAGSATAPASAPAAKNPDEQKAEDWCATNLPKLQSFDAKTSPFSVLTMFESGLVAHKQKFKDNPKVKEALALLDKKKDEVDTAGAADLTAGVVEPVKALNAQMPGSYQAAGALTVKTQRWKSYFVDASDGPRGYAALQLALKSIQTVQQEVLKNRDAAVEAAVAQMNGVDINDPHASEKLEAAFKHAEQWLHASGLPGAADKNQHATSAKTSKKQQIDEALKAKQEKEKQEQAKKAQQPKPDKGGGEAAAASSASSTSATATTATTSSTSQPAQAKPAKAAEKPAASAAAAPASAAATPAATALAAPAHAAPAPQAAKPEAAAHGAEGAAKHDAHAADAHGATPAAHAPDAHAAAAAPGHAPAGEHAHDPAEEAKKLEEEKLEIEREQLEVEIELACQQYVSKVAWGNAGLGALASLGGLIVPGLHIAGAAKSLVAAGAVVKAEYDAKWLTLAIKNLDPAAIRASLQTLHEKERTFGQLKELIELYLDQQQKQATKGDMKSTHAAKHVAAEGAKGEGPEVGTEVGGVGLHLAEHAIEHGAGEAAGALTEQLISIMPFVAVGFGIRSALAAGDKIMNLRMSLIALQDKAEQLGAQTGRKKI